MTQEKVNLLGATSARRLSFITIPRNLKFSFFKVSQSCLTAYFRAFAMRTSCRKTLKAYLQPRWQYIENEGPDGKTKKMKVGPTSSSPDDKGFDRLLPLCLRPKRSISDKKRKSCILLSYIFCNEGQEFGNY